MCNLADRGLRTAHHIVLRRALYRGPSSGSLRTAPVISTVRTSKTPACNAFEVIRFHIRNILDRRRTTCSDPIPSAGSPPSAFVCRAEGPSSGPVELRDLRKAAGSLAAGEGDPILLAGARAWVGWIGLASVLLWACLVGGRVIVARMAAGRLVKSTDRLPFGSYLAVGVWLTWIFGPLGL